MWWADPNVLEMWRAMPRDEQERLIRAQHEYDLKKFVATMQSGIEALRERTEREISLRPRPDGR